MLSLIGAWYVKNTEYKKAKCIDRKALYGWAMNQFYRMRILGSTSSKS